MIQAEPGQIELEWADAVAQLQERVRCRLSGRLRDLQVLCSPQGLVLRGRARTYHAKQLAQEVVMELSDLPVASNEIEVF